MYEDFDAEDRRAIRRDRFKVAASLMDFVGVVGSTVLIVLLMAALAGLYTWLRSDLNATFSTIGQNINEAVVIDANSNP